MEAAPPDPPAPAGKPVLALDAAPEVFTDHLAADAAVAGLVGRLERGGGDKVVAVDCEWSGPAADGADTVQVAVPGGAVYVFHTARMRHFPGALRQLLQDAAITKVGNCLWADRGRLKHNGVALAPCVELGALARDRGLLDGTQAKLDVLVAAFLGATLSKGAVRTSDWKRPLDAAQVAYAALDAWASAAVFVALRDDPDLAPVDRRASPDGVEATSRAAAAARRTCDGCGVEYGVTLGGKIRKHDCAAARARKKQADEAALNDPRVKRKFADLSKGTRSIAAFFTTKKKAATA